MRKRFLYYFIHSLTVLIVIFLSFYLYFRDFSSTTVFFIERIENALLIFVLVLILTNLLDLVDYKGLLYREYDFSRNILSIIGKLIIVVLIVSFIEFFIFFNERIGRVIYLNLFIMLSITFSMQSILINKFLARKKQKILWLSSIPFKKVEKEYLNGYSIGEVSEKAGKLNHESFDFVIYDYPPRNHFHLKNILNVIMSTRNPKDLLSFIEDIVEKIPLQYVDELWLLKNIRTYENVYDKVRRIINFISSLLLLLILYPFACIFAVAHRIESRGPILFMQERLGYEGRTFKLIKFRTMIADAEKDGPKFTIENDPRVTRVGGVMRRFRIDEVPQLINVLKGDMNLIGPRPEREDFVAMLEKKIPYYRVRLEVRPGLTGWAQVNHSYAGEDIEDHLRKLEYDLYYIKNRSLPLDLLIIYKTMKTMLNRRGT